MACHGLVAPKHLPGQSRQGALLCKLSLQSDMKGCYLPVPGHPSVI